MILQSKLSLAQTQVQVKILALDFKVQTQNNIQILLQNSLIICSESIKMSSRLLNNLCHSVDLNTSKFLSITHVYQSANQINAAERNWSAHDPCVFVLVLLAISLSIYPLKGKSNMQGCGCENELLMPMRSIMGDYETIVHNLAALFTAVIDQTAFLAQRIPRSSSVTCYFNLTGNIISSILLVHVLNVLRLLLVISCPESIEG